MSTANRGWPYRLGFGVSVFAAAATLLAVAVDSFLSIAHGHSLVPWWVVLVGIVIGLPTAFVVDRDGRVSNVHPVFDSGSNVVDLLNGLLARLARGLEKVAVVIPYVYGALAMLVLLVPTYLFVTVVVEHAQELPVKTLLWIVIGLLVVLILSKARTAMKPSFTITDFPDRMASWAELARLVEKFSYFSGHEWLFRGVRDEQYQLILKIGREDTRARKADLAGEPNRLPYDKAHELALGRMFRQQARPYLRARPRNALEWLAVEQHFGLPTRLLDWTDTLLVAAWFAVEQADESERRRKIDSAIWITRDVARVPARALDPKTKDNPFDEDAPRTYRPPHISPRIAAQGSVLMLCNRPTEPAVLPFAKKIVIEARHQYVLKKRLNACGINRRHLFPDLEGLCGHLAWLYRHNWLEGYKIGSFFDPAMAIEHEDSDASED